MARMTPYPINLPADIHDALVLEAGIASTAAVIRALLREALAARRAKEKLAAISTPVAALN